MSDQDDLYASPPETEKELTAEEAEALLVRLTRHYKQSVMPVERYCAALDLWQHALHERVKRARTALYPDMAIRSEQEALTTRPLLAIKEWQEDQKVDFYEKARSEARRLTKREEGIIELHDYEQRSEGVDFVFLQIRKSNLLHRLIYMGESLRKEPCPVHQGKWSGCKWEDDNCACQGLQRGGFASDVTGWLP